MWTPSILPRVSAFLKEGINTIDYEFTPWHIPALIGVLVIIHIIERAFDFALFHLSIPRVALQAYKRRGPKPTYALVTGASAGIGFGIAKALVKQGFGVIILGHLEDELAEAATALRAALVLDNDDDAVDRAEYVKTIVMNAITATPSEMEEALRATIVEPGLRVSILVNNVGSVPIALPAFREIATYSPDDIDKPIAMNVRFPARLTSLMLPVIAHRGSGVDAKGYSFGTHWRSLILNVGSAGMVGSPYMVLYGATKAFNWSFSRGLARELELDPATRHVDVLGVIPGDTRTQGNRLGLSKWAPDAEKFGQCVVEKTERALARGWREMYPFWLHHLQAIAQGFVSEKTITNATNDVMVTKKNAWDAEHGKSKHD